MKYRLILVFFIAALPIVSTAQQPGYLNWLRQYWNYRYHLIGDGTIKTQHFPTDCNFLTPQGLGEPGMMVIGAEAGNSYPAEQIMTYNQVAPPYGPDGTHLQNIPGVCYDGATIPPGWQRPNWVLLGNTLSECSQIENEFSQVNNYPPGYFSGVIVYSSEAPHEFAEYIMVLATEWKLLYNNMVTDPTIQPIQMAALVKTESELLDALKEFQRMDNVTQSQFPGEDANDGYFYRDDIPWDLALGPLDQWGNYTFTNFGPNRIIQGEHACLPTGALGGCSVLENDGSYGGEMSQDVAYAMILAMRTVLELVANPNDGITPSDYEDQIRTLAQSEGLAVIHWIAKGPGHANWIIKEPSGNTDVCLGSYSQTESYLLALCGLKMGGPDLQNAMSGGYGWMNWVDNFRPNCNHKSPSTSYFSTGQETGLYFADQLAIVCDAFGNKPGAGKEATRKYEQWDHSQLGVLNIELDLLNAVINHRSPYNSRNTFEGILGNTDYFQCFPWPIWGNASYQVTNYLPWMLLFNLYSLEYAQPTFIDLAAGNNFNFNYTNLQKRTVVSSFPMNIPGNVIGNDANPITIAAADTLILTGLQMNTGARVNFTAPHIDLLPGPPGGPTQIGIGGGVAILTNKRMTCDVSEEWPGSTAVFPAETAYRGNTSGYDDDDSSDIRPLDSIRCDLNSAKIFLNDTSMTVEEKQMLYNTLVEISAMYGDSLVDLTDVSGEIALASGKLSMSVYPNPFGTTCNIDFNLPANSNVNIFLFDITGRKVNTIAENLGESIGDHKIDFNRNTLEKGIYVLQLADNNGNILTQKLIIQ